MSLRRAPDELLQLADSILDRVPHGEAEVCVTELDQALTRFAHNGIHQNVAEASLSLRLRLQHEGRVGVAETRGGGAGAAARLVEAAEQARRLAAPRDLGRLPSPHPDSGVTAHSAATEDCEPELRAELVAGVAGAAASAGVEAYGALSTTARQVALVNSRGLRRHARASAARLVATLRGADGAGYAARSDADVGALDVGGLAAEVVDTTLRNQGAERLEPGDYEVVLSPYAVAELLVYLGWIGFNGLAAAEGRSGIRLGEAQASELVSIVDDATDPGCAAFPFDFEGVACRRLPLVERGRSCALVHDSVTAHAAGVESTGHALPQPNTWGPLPTHLEVLPGEAAVEDLVGGVRRGIWVTRFWYIRVVHELRTVVTGMTREGTFLIEDGQIGRPVRDLRFTESILAALGGVRGVGRERRLHIDDDGLGAVLAPALHIDRFSFTS